jgi:hypothetical protein
MSVADPRHVWSGPRSLRVPAKEDFFPGQTWQRVAGRFNL